MSSSSVVLTDLFCTSMPVEAFTSSAWSMTALESFSSKLCKEDECHGKQTDTKGPDLRVAVQWWRDDGWPSASSRPPTTSGYLRAPWRNM
jgi:hypothetical protein